ncbi:MAG: 50S ribosomal protein L10 [Candidatus Izemoplasmatales bacterium]|jgi:large subunit ribosomal protein L10|nr:50S ribosomal protein L10 [Candidatus Izemoplasmatales bacterium]
MANQNIINFKQEEVKKIAEKMSHAKSIVVAEYQGLTVEKTEELRGLLRDAGCEIIVIKNNISRRAAEEVGYGDLTQDLNGPNGVVFAYEDSVAAAKVLYTFAKKNKKIKIKSGVVDGDFYNEEQIKEISQLPSKETLLAMLATQLLAPLRELSVGLDMITKKQETVESN